MLLNCRKINKMVWMKKIPKITMEWAAQVRREKPNEQRMNGVRRFMAGKRPKSPSQRFTEK